MTKQLSRRFLLIGSFILALSIVSCLMVGCSSGGPSDPDENLTPQSEPANGAILNGTSSGQAAVRVTTAPGESAYVKVKSMSGGTAVGFYVRSGSTAEAYVPAGTYDVQFASGETWYGTSDCFGSKTSYGQDKGVALADGDRVSYTLQRSTSGNFSMGSLDSSDF